MDDPTTSGVTEGFGLMFYNARWYDPYLNRFAQADTVVPGGLQGLDRYGYSNNNPIKYIDPTGHTAWQGDGGESPTEHCDLDCLRARRADAQDDNACHQRFCTDGNLYIVGWQNFNQAWSIYWNPNSTWLQRWLAGVYIGYWGGAHLGLAAGMTVLAIEALIPGSMACVANPACEENVSKTTGEIVEDIANAVGNEFGVTPKPTQSPGWNVTLEGVRGQGGNIVVRMMEGPSKFINGPYFRVGVTGKNAGALLVDGTIWTGPQTGATHFAIDLANPGATIGQIINLVNGAVGK